MAGSARSVDAMTAAQVNGITIEYEEHGDPADEALLLVMGLGAQLIAWPLDFVQLLVDRGFRVIRFDNRDIGRSTQIDAPPPSIRRLSLATLSPRFARSSYVLADMADDAVGLLDHLGIGRAHVVGASMGGMIAQTITIRHPSRVSSLTSIMSNTGDRKNGKISAKLMVKLPRLLVKSRTDVVPTGIEMTRLISGPHFDAGEARQLIEDGLARNADPAGSARQTMAIAASPDRTADLGEVTASTLVIHGLLDPLVKPSGGIATAKAVPGSRLIMYPDMAHDLPAARWPEVVEAIVDNAGLRQRHADAAPSAT